MGDNDATGKTGAAGGVLEVGDIVRNWTLERNIGLPNINEAIADLNGSLFPFGWAKLLWRLKVSGVRTARVPLMGVRDEYQFSRIGPVIALLLIEALRDPFARRKIDALEMSWILETNTGMNNMLERIGAEPYKRYRLYEKQI